MLRDGSVGVRLTVVGVSVAWLVGMLAADEGVAASPGCGPSSGVTSRVSVGRGGVQANAASGGPAISAHGRYVVFSSWASNLVPGDTNPWYAVDVFVRDRGAHVTWLVSIGPDGAQSNGRSGNGFAISPHGRYVAFDSYASNLVAGDTNGTSDVFVWDRKTRVTRRVSVGPGGTQANGNFGSSGPVAISAHGRYVAFVSDASNLVAVDTNGISDVFVRDRWTHVTRRVSVGPGGTQARGGRGFISDLAMSAHGRYVAFVSDATDLVAGDINHFRDVFVRDRKAQVTSQVSVGPGGVQANHESNTLAISAHGRYVAFESFASNLVTRDTNGISDVFVRDRKAHVTRRLSTGPGGSQANGDSSLPVFSADGRYLAFSSSATNLVCGDRDTNDSWDVFVRERRTHVTRQVSVGPGGTQANDQSFSASMSEHGRYVGFTSHASNLVRRDTNRRNDVFIWDRFG